MKTSDLILRAEEILEGLHNHFDPEMDGAEIALEVAIEWALRERLEFGRYLFENKLERLILG